MCACVLRPGHPQFRFASLWALIRRPLRGLGSSAEWTPCPSASGLIAQRDLWGKDRASRKELE